MIYLLIKAMINPASIGSNIAGIYTSARKFLLCHRFHLCVVWFVKAKVRWWCASVCREIFSNVVVSVPKRTRRTRIPLYIVVCGPVKETDGVNKIPVALSLSVYSLYSPNGPHTGAP